MVGTIWSWWVFDCFFLIVIGYLGLLFVDVKLKIRNTCLWSITYLGFRALVWDFELYAWIKVGAFDFNSSILTWNFNLLGLFEVDMWLIVFFILLWVCIWVVLFVDMKLEIRNTPGLINWETNPILMILDLVKVINCVELGKTAEVFFGGLFYFGSFEVLGAFQL